MSKENVSDAQGREWCEAGDASHLRSGEWLLSRDGSHLDPSC